MFRMLMIAIVAIPLIGTVSFALTGNSTSPDLCACGFCESGCGCCDGGDCTCTVCECPHCATDATEVDGQIVDAASATTDVPSCCAGGVCQSAKTE